MRVPIIWMDGRVREFAAAFRSCFSRPQHRYFEIVLLALLLCQEAKTLSALLRQVAVQVTLSGLSRFLATAPWSTADVAKTWRTRFDTQVARWLPPSKPGNGPHSHRVVDAPPCPS